jgi:hypothetical protein
MAMPLKPYMKSLAIGFAILSFSQFAVTFAQAQGVPTELNIIVVQGEGAINNVRQRVTHDPVIQVEDENRKPVAGAAVVFALPTEGATGQFGNGGKTLTVMTDAQGRATGTGLKANEYPGKLVIHVNVSYRGLTARTNITQFDEGPPVTKPQASSGGGHTKLVVILALVGAAAGGGAYFATHKSGSSPSTGIITPPPVTSIGITPGAPTIIGPH